MNEERIEEQRKNPFFEQYNTPHDTVPFEKIRLEDFEEAFMEGIRRDDEQIEKTINNPDKPTFDNTIINVDEDKDGYYDLLSRVSTVFFNLLSAETNDEMDALAQKLQPILTKHANDVRLNKRLFERIKAVHMHHRMKKRDCSTTATTDLYAAEHCSTTRARRSFASLPRRQACCRCSSLRICSKRTRHIRCT